jgi:hypothetical protein
VVGLRIALMNDESSNPAQISQFETRAAPQRVVLLGASNLSLRLSRVVEAARAMWDAPLEFFVAAGFGRSYGQESKYFGKKFSGILQSDLWTALECAPRAATGAILADVGNDLAYEQSVESVVEWVSTTLDRLAAHDARIVLNNVPLESLRTVGEFRFRVLRTILFPRCRLSRGELLARAERLSEALASLALARKIPVFSGEKASYGLDPIHPRRRTAGVVWQRMLGALDPAQPAPPWTAPRRADAKLLRRIHVASWSQKMVRGGASPPSARLADGTMIALF